MLRQRNSQIPEPVVEFDESRFVGGKAKLFFDRYENKGFSMENEFKPDELGLDDIFAMYGWGNLASRPANKGSAMLVKEFYANAYEAGENRKCGVMRGN